MVHWAHPSPRNANGNLIVSAVFAGLTDWQSDRKTDRPRYSVRCGVIMRNYVVYGKAAIVWKIYCKINSNTTSRLATWHRQANEIAMHCHFATSTGGIANQRPVATIKTGRVRMRLWLVARRDRSWLWRPVLDLQCTPERRRRVFKSDRNWSSAQCYYGTSRIHDNHLPF